MSYQVLARKWRPQKFADVLGQEHITRTLQNAITADRVGHAYLFVGPRGIGKTTSARIFAKALNCADLQHDAQGRPEPCCECSACREIAAGNCLDVLELDGASHNKVEDIRDICDNVQYAPTHGRRHKIYIIDEVHMLSTAAWNALLKTLEEPPAHVKFLFATTEPHRVLPTILSRTQRFDLRRIPVPTIVGLLRQIATEEKICIDGDALTAIARAADGGMRDAQSIMDQMIAFCGGRDEASAIGAAAVTDVFGLTSQQELLQIQDAMLRQDAGAVIGGIHYLADRGRDLERLYADLLEAWRNLMVFGLVEEPEKVLEISPAELEALRQIAGKAPPAVVQRLTEGLLAAGDQIRNVLNKRVFLEVTLLKVMQDAHAVRLDDVIAQLRQLRKAGEVLPGDIPPAIAAPAVRVAAAPAPSAPTAPAGNGPTATPADPAGGSVTAPRRLEASTTVFQSVQSNPFVKKVCSMFDGQVVDAKG